MPLILLYLGNCQYLTAIPLEIQTTLKEISNELTTLTYSPESGKRLTSEEKFLALKEQLNEVIKFHSDALRFEKTFFLKNWKS